MHVSLRAEIAEKIAKQQQLTYTMGLKLYRSRIKRKLNHPSPSLGSMNKGLLKVRQSRNDFFKTTILPKNERMNFTLLL